MGDILSIKGEIKEAQHCYLKAIAIQSDFVDAYINLGSLYAKKQQWDLAINYYQKAIQIESNLAKVYINLAKVWTHLNKPQETADCWYTALTLEPEKFSAQDCVNLGNTLVQLGEITKGICCYQYAINLNPNLLGAYQNLGEL